MLKEAIDGFCMALADSVPGVSGGTVAFIMGFYDRFIGSINQLIFGKSPNLHRGANS
jgi:putative membrane protein